MKLKRLSKNEAPILSSTLFFTGIVLSAGSLYTYQANRSDITIVQLCATIGLTFLAGWFSIYFTSRSIRQTVVYVAKKEEQETERHVASEKDEDQLAFDPLEEILRGADDPAQSMVNGLARQLQAAQIALYVSVGNSFELKCGFALSSQESRQHVYASGEGLVGRAAEEGNTLFIDKLPTGYITVFSGLGAASPTYLAIVPLKQEDNIKGVLEVATFVRLSVKTIQKLEQLGKIWAQAGL